MLVKRIMTVFMIFIVVSGISWSTITIADKKSGEGSALKQMAEIMHRLKHFPSPQGKKSLQAIIDNESTKKNERTLATVMLNLEHKVIFSDTAGLDSILANKNATADEKAFAKILLNFSHRPSSEDKKRLKAMMKQ